MELLSKGEWILWSQSDPRWNRSGDALVGGFVMPREVLEAYEAAKQELGEPPADLEWSYMKD